MTRRKTAELTPYQFLTDEKMFGSLKPQADSWRAWNTIFKGIGCEALTQVELEIWREITGGREPLKCSPSILQVLAGRRSGKSVNVARLALREAFTGNYHPFLAPGESPHVLIISVNKRSGETIFKYMRGLLKSSSLLWPEVEHMTKHEIFLRNGVVISVYPCSHISSRGLSVAVLILDEAGFFKSEGVVTDQEIYRSVRPAMAQFPNSRVFIISSPWSKSGLVYDFYKNYYGISDEEILVVKATSVTLNPTLSSKFLEKEKARDPQAYAREFEAEFIEGISEFLPLEAIESCVDWGVYRRPYDERFSYRCGVDAAGGGAEFFSFAVSHRTANGGCELDAVDGWNRQKPETCVERICEVLREYHVSSVTGDKYSASWVISAFERRGIKYLQADKNKSEYLLELGPMILQGSVRLVENKHLLRELQLLERRSGQSGKDMVGHTRFGTDDFANTLAISVYHSRAKKVYDWSAMHLPNLRQRSPHQIGDSQPARDVQHISLASIGWPGKL